MESNCTCGHCDPNKERENLNQFCSKEEMMSLKVIRTRVTCANQALSPASIPKGAEKEDIDQFVKSALNAKADNLLLEEIWWEDAMKKYQLPKGQPVYIDFETNEFYVIKEKKKKKEKEKKKKKDN